MFRSKTRYLYLLPALLVVLVIAFYPLARCLWLSFFEQSLTQTGTAEFVGIQQYKTALADPQFHRTIWNTGVFTVISVTLEFLIGLGAALLLNATFRLRGWARAIALIPWALPPAVMAMAWRWIYNDTYGVFNDALLRAGIISEPIAWLGLPGWAMASAILADVWKTFPFITIILLAGLQSIPRDLYEAIKLDGAGWWHQFFRITLPLLRPYIGLALLFRTVHAFGVFDLIWVLTAGGPGGSTQTVSLYIYDNIFRYLNLGYGAALTVITFLILFILAGGLSLLSYKRAD